MSRTRWFTLLTACYFLASAARADDLGYVDCASHPESAPLFGKARQTPDALGSVSCGERFTVLVYGFVFSRVQTKDGKVGYIYSNLITPDRGGASASQAAANPPTATSADTPANASAKTDAPPATARVAEKAAAQAGALFPTPPMPAVTPSDTASGPGPSSAANLQPPPADSQAASGGPAPSPSSSGVFPARQPAATAPPPPSSPAQADSQAQAAAAQPALAQHAPNSPSTPPQEPSPAQSGPLFPNPPQPAPPTPPSGAREAGPTPVPASAADSAPVSAAAEPAPPPAASQPEATQPAPDPVRSSRTRSSWERPLPGIHHSFLVELYSGYTFDRASSGGTSSNLSGGMGSVGYNLKPWLQIVADTSYNLVSSGGVKNVLYGNHFGGRYFYHWNRWDMTPFAEGLVGGSRFDITVSGTGGYKTSDHCLSYKAGGGIDIRVKKHWEIRVIDLDYYRTSFGGTTQNNYWASAGVVLRLFGSGASE